MALEHKHYVVGTDFNGGYVIMAKVSGLCSDYLTVARYDSEGGEEFLPSVTDEQKEAIQKHAKRAGIL